MEAFNSDPIPESFLCSPKSSIEVEDMSIPDLKTSLIKKSSNRRNTV